MNRPALLAKYDRPAPRYTSYPTALQLSTSVGVAEYEAQLARDRDSDRPLSLYVHVPFCKQACAYCGCARVIAPREARAKPYLAALHKELEALAARVGRRPVVELHFGGGTPTYLSDEELGAIISAVGEAFEIAPQIERSIEIDPRTVDRGRVLALARMGFDRMSFGVQDFDELVQETIRRKQSVSLVHEAIDAAREAKVRSVNFDLIYGLPHQTQATFGKTLDAVIEMRPDRVAIFGYAHLPSRFPMQRTFDPASIPGPAERLALVDLAARRLSDAGYLRVGLDHFALPTDGLAVAMQGGGLARSFQGYTTHGGVDTVGLGPTAIGHVGRLYAQNARELGDYVAALEAGRLPIERGMVLDDDDAARAEIIDALMCQGCVDVEVIERRHAIAFWPTFGEAIAPMAEDGLVERRGQRLALTELGRPFARVVCTAFDRYLEGNAGRHAQPV